MDNCLGGGSYHHYHKNCDWKAMISVEEIEKRFSYHAPKGDQLERYEVLRSAAKQYAHLIARLTPPSREQSLALTHLEEAVMMANASIARNE